MNEIDFINKWSPNAFSIPFANHCFKSDLDKLKQQIRAEVIEEVLTILKTHHIFRTCEDNFVPSIEVRTYTYLFLKFKELKEQNK